MFVVKKTKNKVSSLSAKELKLNQLKPLSSKLAQAILTELAKIPPSLSYAISLSVGLYILFLFHKSVTFKGTQVGKRKFAKFLTLYFIFYPINWWLVNVLIFYVS